MATVTRENIGLLIDKITVSVSKDDYLPSFEKSLKSLSKSANIPGFRKGMVPTGMIRKMHGQAVYSDEVLRSVEKELGKYLEQEKLQIFAQPLPVESNDLSKFDFNRPEEYSFGFEIGLKPEFSLPDLSQHTLPFYKVVVPQETIEEEIERLRLRHGKMSEPEAVSGDDDVLTLHFTEIDTEGNAVENGISKESSILMKYFAENFRPGLIGMKAGESRQLVFDEAFAGKEKEWIAKDLELEESNYQKRFLVSTTKLEHVERAEYNEEFFNLTFPGKEIASEEEFRQAVKADIETYWITQAQNHLEHEVYHVLLDNTHIDLPENFLKRWMKDFNGDPKSAEEVEAEYPKFSSQLKWTLISDYIIENQHITVEQADLREHAKGQLLGYMGMTGSAEEQPWMGEFIERVMKDKKFLEDAYTRIEAKKLFEWAAATVTKQETPVSPEEFAEKTKAHQHHDH